MPRPATPESLAYIAQWQQQQSAGSATEEASPLLLPAVQQLRSAPRPRPEGGRPASPESLAYVQQWQQDHLAKMEQVSDTINLNDRAGTLKALRSVPKQYIPDLIYATQTTAAKKPRQSYSKRLGKGVATGAAGFAQAMQELAGLGGTEEEIAVIQQLEAAGRQELYPAGTSTLANIPVQAAEMAFPMVAMAGGGGLAGGLARGAVGAGALGGGAAGAAAAGMGAGAIETAATAAGVAAAAFPGEYRQSKATLLDAGVDPTIARPVAALTGLVSGVVESIVPNPFKGTPVVGQGVKKAVSSYLGSVLRQYPGELSEEFLQSVVHSAGETAATYMDTNAPDVPFDKKAFKSALTDTVHAAGPLALLMGAPAAVQVPSLVANERRAPQAPPEQPTPPPVEPVTEPEAMAEPAPIPRDESVSPEVMGPPAEPPSRAMQVAQELERMPAAALGTQFFSAQQAPRKPVWYDEVKRLHDADPQRSWRDIRRELVTGGRFVDAEQDRVAEEGVKQQEVESAFTERRFENQEAESAQLASEGWKVLPAGTVAPPAFEAMAGEFGQSYYRLKRGGKKLGKTARTPDKQEPSPARHVGGVSGPGAAEGKIEGREVSPTADAMRGVPDGGQAGGALAEPVEPVTDMMSVKPDQRGESKQELPASIRDLGDDEARQLYRTMTSEKAKRRKNKQTGLDETYYQSDTADVGAIKVELSKILGGLDIGTNRPKAEKKVIPPQATVPEEPAVPVPEDLRSGEQATIPTTPEEAAEAWAAKERVGVDAGFDLNAIDNQKQRILQIAKGVSDEWKTLDEVTPKKIGRQAELRASVPQHLKDLRELGYAQMAWDKQGNTYHAKAGVPLPEWLTQSENDADLEALPSRGRPAVEAEPIVSEGAGEVAETAEAPDTFPKPDVFPAENMSRESLDAMEPGEVERIWRDQTPGASKFAPRKSIMIDEILREEPVPPAKKRLGLRPMGAESVPPDRTAKRIGKKTAGGDAGALKIGDELRIMSVQSVLAKQERVGGTRYELFNGAALKEQRAVIRVIDEDSGNVIQIKRFPTYDAAEQAFDSEVSKAQAMERPSVDKVTSTPAEVPGEVSAKEPWEMTAADFIAAMDDPALSSLHVHRARTMGLAVATDASIRDYFRKLKAVAEKWGGPESVQLADEAENAWHSGKYSQATEKSEMALSMTHTNYDAQYGERPNAELASDIHRGFVEQALADGKPVSSDVLADYPDLDKTPSTPAEVPGEVAETEKPAPDPVEPKKLGKKVEPETPPTEPYRRRTSRQGEAGDRRDEYSEIAGRARNKTVELQKQREELDKTLSKTRRNATNKRAQLRGQINGLDQQIREQQDTYETYGRKLEEASIEDWLEAAPSEAHRLAGLAALERLRYRAANDTIVKEGRYRGDNNLREMAERQAKQHESERDRLEHDLSVIFLREAQSQGDGLNKDEIQHSADAAQRDFSVTSRGTVESHVASAIKTMVANRPRTLPASFSGLTDEEFKQFNAEMATAADSGEAWWQAQQDVIARAGVAEEAGKKRLNEAKVESDKVAAEEAKVRAVEAAKEARERRKAAAVESRYWRTLKERAAALPTRKEVIKITKPDGIEKRKVEHLDDNWRIEESKDENGKSGYAIKHKDFPDSSLESATSMAGAKQFWVMMGDAGVDLSYMKAGASIAKEDARILQKVEEAWDKDSLDWLESAGDEGQGVELRRKMLASVAVPDAGIEADLILGLDDIGHLAFLRSYKVGKEQRESTQTTMATIKSMVKEVPEFGYDPVFRAERQGKELRLVYRDGYKFSFPAEFFGLAEGELHEGMLVGLNLPDLGFKRKTAADVVADVLQGEGFTRVSVGKSGDTVSGSYKLKKVYAAEVDGKWGVTGKGPGVSLANNAIGKIRWTQPGQTPSEQAVEQMRAAGSYSLGTLDDASPSLLELKKQPTRKGLRKGLSKEVVAELTHGRVTSATVAGMRGWHVEVGDSYMTILDASRENFRAVIEDDIGQPIPDEEWATMNAAGAFLMELPDGTRHTGLGFILLSEASLEGTLAHELLHLGRAAGLIGDMEWQSLVDRFAPGEQDAYDQEEMIANATEMTQERDPQLWGILERVRAWVRRVLAKLGVGPMQSHDVFLLMKSAGYWAGAKSPGGEKGGKAQRQRSPESPSPGEAADFVEGDPWKSIRESAGDVKYSLKKVRANVKTGPKETATRTYTVSFDPALLATLQDKPAKQSITTLKQARSINASPTRAADWKKIYAKAEKIGDAKLFADTPKGGKLVGLEVLKFTTGCQRAPVTAERVANGILPNETRVEACYGGNCWVNETLPVKFYSLENMEVRDLTLPDSSQFERLLTPARVAKLNKAPFLREGYAGDSSHLFATGDAVAWLKAAKKAGVKPKTVFVSAGYAPVTDEQYKALLPYKNQMEIHFSVSGWFHKNEIMQRLAEFDYAKSIGLPATLRVISNRDNVSDMAMPNHAWLIKQMAKMGVTQGEVLETPFHDDSVPPTGRSEPGRWRSSPSGDFKFVCCETHACGTCKYKCMTKKSKNASSVQQTHIVDVPSSKVAEQSVEKDPPPKSRSVRYSLSYQPPEQADQYSDWPHGFGAGNERLPDPSRVSRTEWLEAYMPYVQYALPAPLEAGDLASLASAFGGKDPFAEGGPLQRTMQKFAMDGDFHDMNWADGLYTLSQSDEGLKILEDVAREMGYTDDIQFDTEFRVEKIVDALQDPADEDYKEIAKLLQPRLEQYLSAARSAPERVDTWGVDFLLESTKAIQDPLEYAINVWEQAQRGPTDMMSVKYSLRGDSKLRGRPDLANIGESAGARNLLDTVDETRNQEGRPDVLSDEAVAEEVDRRLADDYDGVRERVMKLARAGSPLDPWDTEAARRIYNREYEAAMRSSKPDELEDVIAVAEAWRESGAAWGRSGRLRQDRDESPAQRMARAIGEAILTPPERQRVQREALRRKGRQAEKDGHPDEARKAFADADAINRAWAKRFAELKAKLKILGVDLDNLNEAGYSRQKAADVIAVIHHIKSNNWDRMYEYWRNAILSAPTTQAANAIGNTAHSAWALTAERMVETLVNAGVRDPMGAQIGEYKYLVQGILPGIARGARNFMTTWRTESPTLEYEIGQVDQWRIEDPNTAIGGRLGKTIRWPQRLLLAVDDFAKSVFTEMEVGAQAYRIAKSEGKTGDELSRRVAQLQADYQSQAWRLAYGTALELTFQQPGGEMTQKIKRQALSARRDIKGLRYLLPFVTTPVNIFATGLKKSPLGTVNLGAKMWDNWQKGERPSNGLTGQMAQQVLAWAMVLALMDWTDPDDPVITGSAGEFDREAREVGYRTRPPQSIRLGGQWYSYSRLEPFATVLGLTVDWIAAFRSGDSEKILNTPLESLVGQAKNKTFLSGVADVLKALEADKPLDAGVQWASNFATSWVPNVVRAGAREADETYMNRRVWGKKGEWWGRVGRRTLQKTEVSGLQDYPIYDVWGRPAQRSESPVGSDWLYRILVPVKTQESAMFTADRLILNYNNANPEDERFPLTPPPYYQRSGKTTYMTDGQYADFVRLSGEAAVAGLSGPDVKLDPDNPSQAAVRWINDVATEARSKIRERLIKQWEGGDKKAISAEEIGKDAAEDALGAMAWSVASSVAFDSDAEEAAEVLAELSPDKGATLGALRRKMARSGKKAESIRTWTRRLVMRWENSKKTDSL